ncbi:MAG: hypothetical protein U0996_07625 [Planctomycetaceae bacterium]
MIAFRQSLKTKSGQRRSAYTLMELLIVVGIMSLLLAMTVAAVRFTRDADRITAAAAQVQSFINGARDRAIFSRSPIGVRLFLDVTNPRTVSSMAYIDPAGMESEGSVRLFRWDPDFDGRTNARTNTLDINQDGIAIDPEDGNPGDNPAKVWMVVGEGVRWWELKRRGLLFDGMRIRIPAGINGNWYPVNTRLIDTSVAPTKLQALVLGVPYRDPGDTPVGQSMAFKSGGADTYELQLAPTMLPVEPSVLPENVVIDLDASKVPDAWRPSTTADQAGSGNAMYSQFIDLIYSPRGGLGGEAAAGGVIHFYVCDREESTLLKEQFVSRLDGDSTSVSAADLTSFNLLIRSGLKFVPADELKPSTATWSVDICTDADPYLTRDRRIVSIFGQTGSISVHPVNALDPDNNGLERSVFCRSR